MAWGAYLAWRHSLIAGIGENRGDGLNVDGFVLHHRSLAAVRLRARGMLPYLSNHPNVLTETGWESSSGVLRIGEPLIAFGIQLMLEVLEVVGELEHHFVRGALGHRQGVLPLLKRMGESQ